MFDTHISLTTFLSPFLQTFALWCLAQDCCLPDEIEFALRQKHRHFCSSGGHCNGNGSHTLRSEKIAKEQIDHSGSNDACEGIGWVVQSLSVIICNLSAGWIPFGNLDHTVQHTTSPNMTQTEVWIQLANASTSKSWGPSGWCYGKRPPSWD